MVTMGLSAFAQTSTKQPKSPSQRPTLVVGIFVEGLTADYVNLLRGNFGKEGFNRFMEQGVTMDFGPGIDATAATAMLVTGAAPGVNGIPSGRVWDTEAKIDYPILLDPAKIGNFTDETFSPQALRVSTLTDEVRIGRWTRACPLSCPRCPGGNNPGRTCRQQRLLAQ